MPRQLQALGLSKSVNPPRGTIAALGSPRPSRTAWQRGKVAAAAFMASLGLWFGGGALVANGGGEPGDALVYSRGFLTTGDYAVGGVDLREEFHIIQNGFSTAPIPMSGVPANADILAAYVFWETVTTGGDAWKTEAVGVKFRGFDLDVTNVLSVKRTEQPSVGSACYGSGSLTMHMFRGDVLRFLPVKVDSAGKPTGKRLVNSADLTAQGLDPHTVTLPVRSGNGVPESAGASLVVVYRDPNPSAPLKKVVIYDGNTIKPDNTALGLTIKGFYGSAATASAKITHIVSSGQPNSRLRFSFQGAEIGASPFTDGPASQRWWANPTVALDEDLMPGVNTGAYGETVQTSIYHSNSGGGYDCVALGAVVFSTAVEDFDKDGLPDALENAATQTATLGGQTISYSLLDADGRGLPALGGMFAGSSQPDIFIEVNAMTAAPGTTYGSLAAPYDSRDVNPVDGFPDVVSKPDGDGHNHMPTPYVLKLVGDAFDKRGIRVHFDVGNVAAYKALGVVPHPDFIDNYNSDEADAYLVPSALSRGGEIIKEVACDPTKPGCHFPAYPGAVPWKLGLQSHRDAPVDDLGNELIVTSQGLDGVTFANLQGGAVAWTGRRRFDPERRGLFKYLLYAHSRGNPKSLPCLTEDGQPSPYNEMADLTGAGGDTPSCHDWNGDNVGDVNPDWNEDDYNVPTSASGIAELPGGNFMVTMGFWDDFVGRPFARASTTFHELGHTLGLFHGGPETTTTGATWQPGAVIWGNPSTPTWVEANCKPNYLSSMSYMFQIHGLFDDTDQINLDYSWSARGEPGPPVGLDEASLSDGALLPVPTGVEPAYQPAWFAPTTSPLAFTLGVPAAKRYCSGARFGAVPPAPMARVHPEFATDGIDWDGNGLDDGAANHDANFDNTLTSLGGFSDWDNIRLNQTGAIVTSVGGGSAEGVWFDNAGGVFFDNAGGVFFDNSGVFFDQSGVWFDNSGVWFDNAGGVFSGVFFDNSGGVFFDNSGVWFDNAGGVWFDNAGGVFFDNAGGVFFDQSGVFFDNAGGVFFDNSGAELTFEDSLGFGRGRPHKSATCVIDETTDKLVTQQPPPPGLDPRVCSTAQPNEAYYHRIEVQFEQLQVGGIDDYLVERMSTAATQAPDNAFAAAGTMGGTVPVHLSSFTDDSELADGVVYTYRVRGRSTDEFGNSGWSRSVTETAVNVAPEAAPDGVYTVAAGSTLTVLAPGILANDTDVDSPASSRRVVSATAPSCGGAFSFSPAGGFTYTPGPTCNGDVTFSYTVDNGAWSGDPSVSLNGDLPLDSAAVTINVTNDPPVCSATLTANVVVGSTTTLTHNCTDPNGQTLTVTAAGPVTGGGSVALTNPVSASFTFTAPTTPTTATFPYTVSDGIVTTTGNATITVTLPPPYGFVNVQNLPPPATKTHKTGSTIPMKWQWTTNGVAVNTAGQARVRAYACSTTIPPGVPIGGEFTPEQPGSGNSFAYTTSSKTWTFNLKLWYSPTAGVLTNLPIGTYVVQVQNSFTQQVDPGTTNTCGTGAGAVNIKGALIKVVKWRARQARRDSDCAHD